MKAQVRKDITAKILASIEKMARARVLVGIPQETKARGGDKITNAALGYIHEFGAPEANIPARPFLIPGVRAAQGRAMAALKSAARKALKGGGDITEGLAAAGQAAASAVKRKITAGPFAPLSPNTRRKRDKGKGAKQLAARKPLIDTGQLRNAVTYVVKK